MKETINIKTMHLIMNFYIKHIKQEKENED